MSKDQHQHITPPDIKGASGSHPNQGVASGPQLWASTVRDAPAGRSGRGHRRHLQECRDADDDRADDGKGRSEEHTSELQSLMRISYAVFCLKKKKNSNI